MIMSTVELTLFLCVFAYGSAYRIVLTNNAPVVVGATVSFRAEVTEDNGHRASGTFQFRWRDNAIPSHSRTVDGEFTVSHWNVTYPMDLYSPGTYEVQVEVRKWTLIYWSVASKRAYFDLTPLLNGNMNMTQNHQAVQNSYVSSDSEVMHQIRLKDADQAFISKNATSVAAYWFVNCTYYGATSDLTFRYNYSGMADQVRVVEALVVASYEPLPPPPTTTTPAPPTTSTTTAKPNVTTTTTVVPTTTTAPNITTTTVRPSNNITALVTPNLKVGTNISEIPILPYVCLNTSIVAPDPKKTYGYFAGRVNIKGPVSNVLVTGSNWLQHGEILSLQVSCGGSGPFHYCFQVIRGDYNVTGNETCLYEYQTPDCNLTLPRYLHEVDKYTIVIIIRNQVSHKITPYGVNIYYVKKHPQLSVIWVPVVCCAIAVTLIVFGAAYLMQGRHRYTVEVADFDFAQASDLEYMTFGQRLREALDNAFSRTHDDPDIVKMKKNKKPKTEDCIKKPITEGITQPMPDVSGVNKVIESNNVTPANEPTTLTPEA